MEAKIAGLDANNNKANAICVVLMVGAVEKVGLLEMDVMVLLGGLLITNVCLNRRVCFYAKGEFKKNAKNKRSRMILEVFDGSSAIHSNPHFIIGVSQAPDNGFYQFWIHLGDINAMIEIVNQNLG